MRLSSVITVIVSLMLAFFMLAGIASFDLGGANVNDSRFTRVNAQPVVTSPSVNPTSIVDNADASVTFSADATDSDGTVTNVTVTSSLWTGSWYLTKGTGNTWSGTFQILKANLTSLGAKAVTFTAEDNASGTGTNTTDLTVALGNTAPTSDYDLDTPYAIQVEEDSGNYIKDLLELVDDDDIGNVSFKIGTPDSFGTSFTHDNFTVALVNDTWINVTLEEDAFNDPVPFTVNVTDPNHFINFNITFEITPVNDVPTWTEVRLVEPSGSAKALFWGENLTLDVNEDSHYNFTVNAADIDDAELTFKSNVTNKEGWFVLEENGNISFDPTQEDVNPDYGYGLLYVEVQVFDSSSTSTPANKTNIIFNVSNVNDAPGAPKVSVATEEKSLEVNLSIEAPTDEDGDTMFKYTIDWDDGSTDTVIDLTDATNLFSIHEYEEDGLYLINVTVEDEAGDSNYALAEEINLTGGASIEWEIMPFKLDDKSGDALETIDIEITSAAIVVTNEVDVPSAGKSTMTMTYTISGTCSDDVTVIHLYWDVADIGYTTFYDPNDYTVKTEITPESGAWSVEYVWELEYDTPEPTTDDDDDDDDVTLPEYWFCAVAWSEEGYNLDEKLATYTIGGGGDDDDDDDDDDTGLFGGLLCILIPVIVFVFLLIIIIIIVVVIVKKKGKKKEEPPAPAAPPVTCFCGTQIPEGMDACPSCGAPKPAPQDQQQAQDLYAQQPPPPPSEMQAPPPMDDEAAALFAADPNAPPPPEDYAANAPGPSFGESMPIEDLPEESAKGMNP